MVLNVLDEKQKAAFNDSDESTRQILTTTINEVNTRFDSKILNAPTEQQRTEVTAAIGNIVPLVAKKLNLPLPAAVASKMSAEAARRVLGLGFLDLLLPPARDDLSEITIYSQTGHVAVMKKGSVRWENTDLVIDPDEAMRVINKIIRSQSLSVATPIISAKLQPTEDNPGGGRINALHASIAPGVGPCLNIRLYEQEPVDPQWIVGKGALSQEMMDFLADMIREGKRILIGGGTRTGKTTLLSAVLNFLPEGYRIVTVEDPVEIWIPRKEVQSLEARHVPPGLQLTPITLFDLVRSTMRMSPDYLVVGEVRDGQAAATLMDALSTGHAGACTYHADTPRDAFVRMGNSIQRDVGGTPKTSATTIANGLDLYVQINIVKEIRRVTLIAHVENELKGGDVWWNPVYKYDWDSPADKPRWEKVKSSPTTMKEKGQNT